MLPQLYTVISTRAVLTSVLGTAGLGLVYGIVCVLHVFLTQGHFICFMVSFCVFGVFSLICFELSVPVQVIVWKDSCPK